MNDILNLFLGLVLGAILMYWLFSLFRKKQGKEVTKHQSKVLLEKVKSVCKLISVEGEFAEIYTYENTKQRFMSMISSKKKALIVVTAKAHIGYDLQKITIDTDIRNKKITLTHFPLPEILSIEPELEFYDIKNGMFNTFTPNDLTILNQEAKQHIRDKIPASGLMENARKEAMDSILLMKSLVETIGWQLDFSALEIQNLEEKVLEK